MKLQLDKNIHISILTSLVGVVLTYFIFGFYYVEYEGLFDSFYSGKLTPGFPFKSIYFLGNIGTSYIYAFFYENWSSVEWLSWFYSFYLLLASIIGLHVLSSKLPPNLHWFSKGLFLIAVYFLIISDNSIHFIYTRISYIISGVSLVALVVVFKDSSNICAKKLGFLGLNCFFTLGVLTRLESGIASYSIVFFFAIVYMKDLKSFLTVFFFPTLLAFGLLLTISCDIKNTTEFYKQIEPEIEAQLADRGNIVPLSTMISHRDSIKYDAAQSIMWSDPNNISATYLRSLILPEKFFLTDGRQWNRTLNDFSAIALKYWYLLGCNLIITLLLFYCYISSKPKRELHRLIVFELSFWVLLLLQTYTVKINDRSFVPFVDVFMLCHILLVLKSKATNTPRARLFLGCLVSVTLLLQLYFLKIDSNLLKENLRIYKQTTERIKEIARDKYLVMNPSSFDGICLSNTPFHAFDFSAFKKVYITDGYNIPFLPYYRPYLESECHCNISEFPGFWIYLKANKDKVVIVSSPSRIETIKSYTKEFYNLDLDFIRIETLSPIRKSGFRDELNYPFIYTFE